MDSINDIISNVQAYVVAPLNAFGMSGYLFDAQGESLAHLSADITDSYAEDNRALQDHIAIRPKRITLKGYVGELVYTQPNDSNSTVATLSQKLTEISGFLPALSAAAVQLQELIQQPENSGLTLNGAANIYGTIKNLLPAAGNQSRQQNAYLFFKACMEEAILMGVQTPWEFMTSMAIESIVALQPETTQYITDFSVTFKQVRIASTSTIAYAGAALLSSIAQQQGANPTNLGLVPGVGLPYNGLPGAQSLISGASDLKNISGIGGLF